MDSKSSISLYIYAKNFKNQKGKANLVPRNLGFSSVSQNCLPTEGKFQTSLCHIVNIGEMQLV